jgi:hypothetical protein
MGDILVHAVGAIAFAAGTLSPEARAQAEEPAPIDWGVRVNGSVGAADAGGALSLGSGPAARAGLEKLPRDQSGGGICVGAGRGR